MKNLEKLVKGYKTFLKQDIRDRYRDLAMRGQSPKIMVIGCSDSRVNPDFIFNTGPGDLFVVRNVANLVPPFEGGGGYHGTSAAIEFAVTVLGVEHIVIMGHSFCGGVKACCDHLDGVPAQGVFISQWTSILNECAADLRGLHPDVTIEELRHKVELDAIKRSLENLRGFPFIENRLQDGQLHIYGAYFDISDAQLFALDQESGEFVAVE